MNQKERALRFRKEYGEVYDRIRSLTLMNNELMSKVFEDKECVELILRIIMQRKDIHVISSTVQKEINNLQGRSIVLDIFAEDDDGNMINVEIQRSDEGANPHRARYYGSLVDANITHKGEEVKDITDTYIIFITANDVIGKGLPIYHIERTIQETNEQFQDGSHIIYVNAKITDNSELGKLMQDFQCADYSEMNYDVLRERVKYFKDEEEGVIKMKDIVDEWEINKVKEIEKEVTERITKEVTRQVTEEVTQQVTEEVKEADTKKFIQILKDANFSNEEIAKKLELSVAQVEEYQK